MIASVLRRVPLLWVLVLGVCFVFLFVNYKQQQLVVEQRYKESILERERELVLFSKVAEQLAPKDLWDELKISLEEARREKKMDIYLLTFNGQTAWFGEKNGNVENVEANYPSGYVNTPDRSFITTDLGRGYRLTVGIEKDFAAYTKEHAAHFKDVVLEQQIHVVIIIVLVGLWALKDLILVLNEIRKGKRGNLGSLKVRSAETAAFVRGLTGYAQAVDDLQEQNRKLGRQVLPSLQKELHSGRKPPYDFHCTMVRTDINQFSVIYNTHNVTLLMSTINDFFDEVSKIVARYGGLVHEFVGDEVISYFKDDDHVNSFAIAIAAVRDINEAATRFNEKTVAERGYPFTVKSSLAHGKVRFGPLVNGFTVAGSVLIETVRILSCIHDKDENVVYFDGVNRARLTDAIASLEVSRVTLKGYKHEIALHRYDGHRPLSDILDSLDESNVDSLLQYRSDEHLATILLDLRAHVRSRSIGLSLRAISGLRAAYVGHARVDFAQIVCDWIAELKAQYDQELFEGVDKILASVVKLLATLVPKEQVTSAHREQIRELLSCGDRRVVANTVEVLTHWSVDIDRRALKRNHGDDLRIKANAVVLEGNVELTSDVVKKLKALVKSKVPTEIASGLYALGELASLHHRRDPAYYAAQTDFVELVQSLDVYAQHITTSVRRQALIAARKADDATVIERIRRHVETSDSDLMKEEFLRYLESPSAKSLAA